MTNELKVSKDTSFKREVDVSLPKYIVKNEYLVPMFGGYNRDTAEWEESGLPGEKTEFLKTAVSGVRGTVLSSQLDGLPNFDVFYKGKPIKNVVGFIIIEMKDVKD